MRIKKPSAAAKILVSGLALALPVALGALASSATATVSPPVTWNVLVGNQAAHKAIQGEKFLTPDVTIDAGDSVTWHANSAEPHTVTFIDGGTPQPDNSLGFNPGDPTQNSVQGGSNMTGTGYYNSGVLSTVQIALLPVATVKTYTLTFPNAGDYTYYCLVHGTMMRGVVHVQSNGAPYPSSQADYDANAAFLAHAIVADGKAELAAIKAAAGRHKVILGADDGIAMVARFVRGSLTVHKGDTVKWVNTGMGAPHTVTFGAPHAGPSVLAPYGHPASYKGGDLSSGVIPPTGAFKVTFKKVGTFHYLCLFHSELHMVGTVVVKP